MVPVYCISGLGADERVFYRLQLNGCDMHFVKWIQPFKNESIEAYALRLSEQIKDQEPVLIGVSFGGMMAIEIAKIISCKKIFLISSIKSGNELPFWMKLCGQLKLNQLIHPPRKNPLFIPVKNYFLGPRTEEEKKLIDAFRQSVTKEFLEWAVDKILNWKNKTCPANIIHLLGDNDKFFSVKRAKPDHIIHTGTHFMVYNRAKEVGDIVQSYISSL